MCIKLVGLFTETLVCVIVNDPLVLFITFLMYPVLPMYLWIDSRCALEKGGVGISSMLNLVIGLLSGTRAITGFCDLELIWFIFWLHEIIAHLLFIGDFFVDFPTTETLMVHCTWVKILHVIVHIIKCGLL